MFLALKVVIEFLNFLLFFYSCFSLVTLNRLFLAALIEIVAPSDDSQ